MKLTFTFWLHKFIPIKNGGAVLKVCIQFYTRHTGTELNAIKIGEKEVLSIILCSF